MKELLQDLDRLRHQQPIADSAGVYIPRAVDSSIRDKAISDCIKMVERHARDKDVLPDS